VRFRTLASLFIVPAFVLAIPSLAAAQAPQDAATSFGIKAGLNVSSIKVSFDDGDITSDGRAGFLFGFFMGHDFNRRAGIQVEALFSQKGGEFAVEEQLFDDDASFTLSYLEFPVLARINFLASSNKVRLLTGPTFAFNVNESIKVGDVELDGDEVPLKPFEMGYVLGGAFEIRKFIIDARYTWGLMDINDSDDEGEPTVKNNAFSFSVGWRF
jgi:Outer membrane protein beta-barrel domain